MYRNKSANDHLWCITKEKLEQNMAKLFYTRAEELYDRRFDAEYHCALKDVRLSSAYPLTKLLSLASFRTGGTPSTEVEDYWNGDIPWVSAKDFRAFRFEDSEDHITEKAITDGTTYFVSRPALLVVSRSGILQHTLPVMVTHRPTAINQDIKAFFPDNRVTVDYLGVFFDVFGSRLLPLLCKSGATVQSLNTKELIALRIPIPPREVQARIVAELDAAYAAKRKADKKAAELLASIDDFVLDALGIPPLPPPDTSLPARIFTVSSRDVADDRLDPYYYQRSFRITAKTIAKDARLTRLGSVGTFVRGVTYSAEDEAPDGFAILRASNVKLETGEIDLSDLLYVRKELVFDDSQLVKQGDILICAASGSKEHAGKVAYVEPDLKDTYIGGFMTVLRVSKTIVNPRYAAVYMQSQLFRRLILRHLGGTNINNVSLSLLNSLPILIPERSVQEEIVARVSAIRTEARTLKAEAVANLAAAKSRIEKQLLT